MIGHSKSLLFAPCMLALSCSSQGDAQRKTERLISEPAGVPALAFLGFEVSAPETVPLGSTFSASVVPRAERTDLDSDLEPLHWGGEGLRVIAERGVEATLICTWAGFHTIEVTTNNAALLTAQVYCSPPPCAGSLETCRGVRVPPEDARACPKTNLLVRIGPNQQCPPDSDDGWVGAPLFSADDPDNDSAERFCSYSWNGFADHPPVPPASGQGSSWQWDCPRVAAHSSTDDLNEVLIARGQAGLGSLQWKSDTTVPVRIAVVDTAANLWSDPDNNPHGKAVGALALDTACADQTSCDVRVENYLGLPLYREQRLGGGAVVRRDVVHGGSFGAHGHLARAILDAVAAVPNTRTVLNLSLAYEAKLPSTQRPAPGDFENRVVLEALYRARCSGALILAAAGNGPVPAHPEQGAGFPARWTGLRSLSKGECTLRFGVAHPSVSDSPGPLLYAVSGVDFAAQPLLTTRGRGQSAIAALGFAAVRREPGGSYTRRLTGTSMATATVSGIAASLWSHRGNLSPDQLMSALYANGHSTAIVPDLPFPAAPADPADPVSNPINEVRRITRCSIAQAFPGLADCIQDPTTFEASIPAGTLPALPAGNPHGTVEPISPSVRPEEVPWIFPQPPGEPSCGQCSLFPGQLNLAFRPSFPIDAIGTMQLLARPALQSFARVAKLAGGSSDVSAEELISTEVPNPQLAPFSVPLDGSFDDVTAAELSYQITVDQTTIDTTESVLIQQSSGAAGTAAF